MRRGGALKTIANVFVQVERIERTARRRQRDIQAWERDQARHSAFQDKQASLERARYEVEDFESRIEELLTIHHECASPLDWSRISASPAPIAPRPQLPPPPVLALPGWSYAQKAEQELANYTPSLMEKVLGRVAKTRQQLELAVEQGKMRDWQESTAAEEEHHRASEAWNQYVAHAHAQWEREQSLANSGWQQMVGLARGVVSGNPEAYSIVIQQTRCLAELEEKGCALSGNWVGSRVAEVFVSVDSGINLVPSDEKSLTSTGKLSVKKMAAKKAVEIYQDFVCGVAIRAARELTAVLPLQGVLVGVIGDVVDRTTGHLEPAIILSVYVPREALLGRDFSRIDASDFVSSLHHEMKLTKGTGMTPVAGLDPSMFLQRREQIIPW